MAINLIKKNGAIDLVNNNGGTNDYNKLDNKPCINNKELKGNLSTEDLGISSLKDVAINGNSVVTDGVANIPHNAVGGYYDENIPSTYSVANNWTNIIVNDSGFLTTRQATNYNIDNRDSGSKPSVLSPLKLDYAVKAAMCDGKGADWTTQEKATARNRMGLDKEPAVIEIEVTEEVRKIEVTEYNGLPLKDYDYKQMWIIAESAGGLTATNNEVQIRINDATTAGDTVYLSIPTNFTHNASKVYWGGMMDIRNGLAFSGGNSMGMAKWRSNAQASINMSDLLFQENIKGIYLYAVMANFPVGTKFKFILR